MSHVDEGTLHAYLDGALDALPVAEAARVREHLAACEVCAARLEEERALRDEAAAILADAAPDTVELPPFEELRARARARVRAPAARTRRVRLAWAASVVLAVGAGWMLHAAARPESLLRDSARETARGTLPAEVAGSAGEAPPRPRRRERRPRRRGNFADRLAEAAEPSSPDRPVTTEERAGRVAAAPAADAAPVLPASVSVEEPAADVGVLAGLSPSPRALPEPSWVPDEVTGGITTLGARLDTLTFPRTAAEAKEAVAAASRPGGGVVAKAAVAADRLVTPPAAPAEQELPRAREERESPAVQRARRQAAVTVSMAAARSMSLVVPGLQVLSVTGLEGAGLMGAVRVRQLLTDGDTLELVHLPPGTDPSVIPPVPDDGRTELVQPRDGGGWLVARAHASREALLDLVRRMDGGR